MKVDVCDVCLLETKKLTLSSWRNKRRAPGQQTIRYKTCNSHVKTWNDKSVDQLLVLLSNTDKALQGIRALESEKASQLQKAEKAQKTKSSKKA